MTNVVSKQIILHYYSITMFNFQICLNTRLPQHTHNVMNFVDEVTDDVGMIVGEIVDDIGTLLGEVADDVGTAVDENVIANDVETRVNDVETIVNDAEKVVNDIETVVKVVNAVGTAEYYRDLCCNNRCCCCCKRGRTTPDVESALEAIAVETALTALMDEVAQTEVVAGSAAAAEDTVVTPGVTGTVVGVHGRKP